MKYLIIALAGALLGESASAQSRSRSATPTVTTKSWTFGTGQLAIDAPQQGDPADSVYRAATAALQRNDYRTAARLFSSVPQRFPRSASAGDALYWQAFALYRLGGMDNLRGALASLNKQKTSYARARTASGGDAENLKTRVHGELAKLGDAESMRIVQDAAKGNEDDEDEKEAEEADKEEKEDLKAEKDKEKGRRGSSASCARDDDDDMRIAAVNALMQMRAEQAIPILRQVLQKSDVCSISLRKKAVFILSQTNSPDAADILLSVARSDPAVEVRKEAVRWLGDVRGERSTTVLDSVLKSATEGSMRDAALFALSQQGTERARKVVQNYIENPSTSEDGKRKAIQTLGFHFSKQEDGDYLKTLYAKPTTTARMKSEIVQAIGQVETRENGLFLLRIAADQTEPTDVRKNALFWAKDGRVTLADIVAIYPKMNTTEMKRQYVFVLSETNGSGAIDKLIEMAKTDPDREVRKQALFWLGQKDDPRVKTLLLEIINQ